MNDLTGTTLSGQYQLRDKAGAGGMADVYLAMDKLRATRMAVKVLRRDLSNNPTFLDQFSTEAEIYSQLTHPNIVRFYEFNHDGDVVYIVMDWVDGSDLRKILRNTNNPLPYHSIITILEAVCPALKYAHENDIYHCDIKPANIMLQNDGKVLLTDFGVANLARRSSGGGTPPYMAPEQFSGDRIDARTDIYALGITLYEFLAGGKTPYRGETASSKGTTPKERIEWEHLHLTPPPLTNFNPRVPPAIESVVLTAISKKPERRYQSAIDLQNAFTNACTASGINLSTSNSGTENTFLKTDATQIQINLPSMPVIQNTVKGAYQSIARTGNDLPNLISNAVRKISQPRTGVKGPRLYCRAGQYAGSSFELPQGEFIIGRAQGCHLKVNENSVSRRHATLIRSARGLYIRDDTSSLGTYVNNVRIYSPVLLREHDVIQIGYEQVFEVI